MRSSLKTLFLLLLFFCLSNYSYSQSSKRGKSNLIYVDKKGIIRYTKDNKEAAFFGVNYTVPFAYGYRSVKRTGTDIEKAIDQDVYHFSRLGLDAFRVHVWDWEIADSLGNLLENEHLRLFDYLLLKLKERNIKILVTPIAFWGNGYPEKDTPNNSFSSKYGKGPSVVNEAAIKAQENYLKQFFTHVNPYTKRAYRDDPDIIATEINNEPHHSGPKEKTTEYVNRLATAIRSTGWNKPVFYNISESPTYADAVAKANVDGHSFQWYPTGLVANRSLQGNYLPNVDRYHIPFDTIPAFKYRAKMIYEFDAGDVLQPIMYPAMARSFRAAGFQWATQFAYDPMATAYANTEYQTHYLSLAYTPAKAISLLIASKAFHKLPLNKSYGTFPVDTLFDAFRVSYKQQLSEMNTEQEFYYSNNTQTIPVSINKLQRIAGVGSSPVVTYEGTGAYFFDKLSDGSWRLEVMPDAYHTRDPFAKASPEKVVTRIGWRSNIMKLNLASLSDGFNITAINDGNSYTTKADGKQFNIAPGVYILTGKNIDRSTFDKTVSRDFAAPINASNGIEVVHESTAEVSGGKSYQLNFQIIGIDTADRVMIELHNSMNQWKTSKASRTAGVSYVAEVPADVVSAGVIDYRLIVYRANKDVVAFPGNHKGDPYRWDAYTNDTWQTYVASADASIELFNATDDRQKLNVYNPDWRSNTFGYVTGSNARRLLLRVSTKEPSKAKSLGFELFVGDRLEGRMADITGIQKVSIRARTNSTSPVAVKLSLIDHDGIAFSGTAVVDNTLKELELPINSFIPDSALILPRPYPGFQPLYSSIVKGAKLRLEELDKIQVSYQPTGAGDAKDFEVEIESIQLKKD